MSDDVTTPKPLTREFTVTLDRDAMATRAEGDDRIPIAISSEVGVFRYDWSTGERYLEVLDHAAASIDLSRAADGMPFLVDHSTRDMVGLVEDVSVDSDRKLRGTVRFSQSQRGQDIRRDMVDGIRKNISVGYAVGEKYEQTKDERTGVLTRRYRQWTPYEASSVPIPADPTVGVGRAATANPQPPSPAPVIPAGKTADEAKEYRMSEQDKAAGSPAAPALTRDAVIMDQCEAAGLSVADARAFIDAGKSPKEVGVAIEEKRKAPVVPAPAAPAPADYAEKGKTFNIARAIRAATSGNWKEAGYEREVSQAEAKRLGQDSGNAMQIFVPTVERLTPEQIEKRSVHVTSSSTLGGNTVFSEYGGFIDLLRNRSSIMRAGASVLPGLSGNVAFVTQSAAGSASWVAENPGSDVTESNMTFGQVTLSPKTLMARQTVTNKLLAQASINVDGAIRSDLATIIALEIDRAALHGTGASNQPSGLYTISGTNSQAFGGTVTYANLVAMVSKIATANADIGDIAFLVTPETAAKALQVSRFSSTDTPLYQGTFAEGQMIGYRTVVSNQLSKVLGAGTNEHAIVAGVMPQWLVGEWGMALTVDPYTLAAQDCVRLIVRSFVDVNARYAAAFTKGTGLIP